MTYDLSKKLYKLNYQILDDDFEEVTENYGDYIHRYWQLYYRSDVWGLHAFYTWGDEWVEDLKGENADEVLF